MRNDGVNDIDILKLQDLLNNWESFYNQATTEVKRQMIRAIISEVKLKGKEITVEIAFDINKYVESISLVQETISKPAESPGAVECKENDYMQYNDNRCSDGKYIAKNLKNDKLIINQAFLHKISKTYKNSIKDIIIYKI